MSEAGALVGSVALVCGLVITHPWSRGAEPTVVDNGPAQNAVPAPSPVAAEPAEPAPAAEPSSAEQAPPPAAPRPHRRTAKSTASPSKSSSQASLGVGGGPPEASPAAPPAQAPVPPPPVVQIPAAPPAETTPPPVEGMVLINASVLPQRVKLSGLGEATAFRAQITFQNTTPFSWTVDPARQHAVLANTGAELRPINETLIVASVPPQSTQTFTYDFALPGAWIGNPRKEDVQLAFTGNADTPAGPAAGRAVFRLIRTGPVRDSDIGESLGRLYYDPDWQGGIQYRPRVVSVLRLERVR